MTFELLEVFGKNAAVVIANPNGFGRFPTLD
jgi:hypothetical protein